MARVHYVEAGGRRTTVDAPVGTSVMQAAVGAGLPGILAECGGSASCATCHVYVDPAGAPLPAPDPDEDEMLDCTVAPRLGSSRLSCQLTVTAALDGLVVHIPEAQR